MGELIISSHLDIPGVNRYLKEVGQKLIDIEYQGAACRSVAVDVAEVLIRHQIRPFTEELTPDSEDPSVRLIPLVFGGKVRWPWHTICTSEDVVFDPLVQRPLLYDQYLKKMFGAPVIRRLEYDPRGLSYFIEVPRNLF